MTRRSKTLMGIGLIGLVLAGTAGAATLQLLSKARWQHGWPPVEGDLNAVDPDINPIVRYELAGQISEEDNRGIMAMYWSIHCPLCAERGYLLGDGPTPAESGYRNFGGPPVLRTVYDAEYFSSQQPSQPPANYAGGWGVHWYLMPYTGDPGLLYFGSWRMLPFWSGDFGPSIEGIQSTSRLDIGHGAYQTAPEDGRFPNQALGFGSDLYNGVFTGTGEWVFARGYLDVSTWAPGTYVFQAVPESVGCYKRYDDMGVEIDYSQSIGQGFWRSVEESAGDTLLGSTFQFTIVPPYPTCGDLDGDHDVDLADFGVFALCFELSAPDESCPAEVWSQADLNADGVVNRVDFSTFAVIYGTINIKAPPACLE